MIHVYRFVLDRASLLAHEVENPVSYVDGLLREFGAKPAYHLGGVFVTGDRGVIASYGEIDAAVQEASTNPVEAIHRVRTIDADPETLADSGSLVTLDPLLEVEVDFRE